MDLESELRRAMAEHTADASAPSSLAEDVRHRYRRRVTRIRTTVGAATALAVLTALVPTTYHSFRADPVSASKTPTAAAPPAPGSNGPAQPPAPGESRSPRTSENPGAGASQHPSPRLGPGGGHGSAAPGTGSNPLPGWVTYLPSGLGAAQPCADQGTTTTCRWTGAAGTVEIRVVRNAGLTAPEGLGVLPAMPKPASVRGHKAFVSDRPGAARQIAWIDRPGVGVIVTAAGSVRDDLLRIAEGVRP
ncbi:hypothetical protein J4573_29920 [Actinomadura barringtoniae]|uniref:DUF2020 domain-containing protein n=1 Tax=Actinomadura barringtoniae TaxID=1427535 RepID=A0A939T617_9ACTN|nr:hypothetical protein [Actinomadura barringtoniae]MBO2451343.1 hypothetical protein [Actinomadura barringtoniae]